MKINRELVIISDKISLLDILKIIDTKKKFDLVIHIKLSIVENILVKTIFGDIYDLSSYTDKEVIDFYFHNILSLNYTENEVMYDNIYFNSLEKCNIDIKIQEDFDLIKENKSYGHYNVIRNFCEFNEQSYLEIEHGLFFGGHIIPYERKNKCPGIITFSDYRFKYLRKEIKKPVIRIGPYIHYASNLYTDKFISHIKNILGKTLVVFPIHSMLFCYYKYNEKEYINYIKDFCLKNNFKTVLICMHYNDITLGNDEVYKKEGFNIVTCGNADETTLFLNKLKTTINFSDYTMSNGLGTHIGYCIYMNKPLVLFKQNIDIVEITEFYDREANRGEGYNNLIKKEKQTFFKVFEDTQKNITDEQYDLCNLYWGFEHIKSKEEMHFILQFFKEVYIDSEKDITPSTSTSQRFKIYSDNVNLKLENLDNKYKYLILESINKKDS